MAARISTADTSWGRAEAWCRVHPDQVHAYAAQRALEVILAAKASLRIKAARNSGIASRRKSGEAVDAISNRHFISKVVNKIPPLTSAIQAKLLEFKASQRLQPS